MKLGILRTDTVRKSLVDEFGEYPEMFARLFHAVDPSIEIVAYNVQVDEYPKTIDECDAYLITGSSFSVYDDLEWIRKLGEFVRELHLRKKKTVGICFGHQLVAHFLGGKTAKSKTGWSIGTKSHSLNEAGKRLTKSKGFNLIFSHQDQVVKQAPGSQILASTENCPNAMCLVGDHLLTIQGHPEFEVKYARQLMEERKQIFDNDLYEKAMVSFSSSNDRLEAARIILDFIKE